MEELDFIYERKKLPGGVKVEEVTGGARYKGKVWREMARQIYCENGKDGYREIGHFQSGAPFLYGEDVTISISHTDGCYVVATVQGPRKVGVDVERADRAKVKDLRERFLSEQELSLAEADSTEANIVAWTCKEAMLKASADAGIDWRHDIRIDSLPVPDGQPGEGTVTSGGDTLRLSLQTYRSGPFIVTVAAV